MTGKRGKIQSKWESDFNSFLVGVNSIVKNYFISIDNEEDSFKIIPIYGERYIRLEAVKENDIWTWGFIDLKNGDCLKAASYMSPSEKTPRGNIRDRQNGLGQVTWSGFASITCGEGWPKGLRERNNQ